MDVLSQNRSEGLMKVFFPSCNSWRAVEGSSRPAPPMGSLLQEFDAVEPWLTSLVGEGLRERLRDLCGVLGSAYDAGFEVRLGKGEDQVDFGLAMTGLGYGTAPAMRLLESEEFQREANGPEWRAVREWLQELAGKRDDLARIPTVYFEFDMESGAPRLPVPNLFVRLLPGETRLWQDHARLLRGVGFARSMADPVDEQIARIGQHGEVLFLGLMLPRPIEAVRLQFQYDDPADFLDWLRQAPWPGDMRVMEENLTSLRNFTRHLRYNVDVGPEGLLSRVGIEIFTDGQANQGDGVERLLASWGESGHCCAEKAAAVKAWAGNQGVQEPGGPAYLSEVEGAAPWGSVAVFRRHLNHLKWTISADGSCEAKAYLFFDYRVWTPDA